MAGDFQGKGMKYFEIDSNHASDFFTNSLNITSNIAIPLSKETLISLLNLK
jgi:hypothetical protein